MISAGRPTVLSLFSGAGGMDLGVERAGFHHLGFLEFDHAVAETLTHNRPSWTTWYDGDVVTAAQRMTPADLGVGRGELDLIVGGPPCQPFSSASQWASTGRQGMLDPRANTVHALLDLVESFEPSMIMLENVVGFVKGRNAALPVIEDRLDQMRVRGAANYSIHWAVVDAADYGVPQHRRRVIMLIAREDAHWSFPAPTLDKRNSWDAIGDLDEVDTPAPRGKWTGLLPSIPEGSNYQWLTEKGGGEEVFGYRTKYWHFLLKLAKDQPSWTLAASPGPSTGPFHWSNRPLSVREAARLQSFPDEWEFTGTERAQLKQVGNATPPLLAETFALQIRSALDSTFTKEQPTLALSKRLPVPAAEPPRPVPASYNSHVGPKKAHAGVGLGPGRHGRAAKPSRAS